MKELLTTNELRSFLTNALYLSYLPPFWKDGVLTITDGGMLVTIDCEEPEQEFRCSRFRDGTWHQPDNILRNTPDIIEILQFIGDPSGTPIPKVDGPPQKANSRWEVTIPCDRCDGSGHRECNMGHDHECDECDGERTVEEVCREAREPIEIAGKYLQRRYVWTLLRIPGVSLCDSLNEDMVTAKHECGVAVVMTLTMPGSDRRS